MRLAVDQSFGALSTYSYTFPGGGTYDSTKLGLGPLMAQINGGGNETNYVGPLPIGLARPMEFSTAMSAGYPWVIQWSSTIDFIFFADISATGATRKIMYATYNRTTGALSLQGFLIVTFPTVTSFIVQGFRMTYDLHTAGTVSVSGTGVTGTSSTWSADGACVGNRIGFGSSDPTQISTWYEISAIGSDTSITLTTTGPTLSGGTAYVIEDYRAVMACTNATSTNGGLFICKGIRPELFSVGGGAIPAATTVDNIRACYWLKDASTVTNVLARGLAMEAETSKSAQNVWCLDSTTNIILYKYNIRAALTSIVAGATVAAFIFKTGAGGTLTGTISATNNGRCATLGHGPGIGANCIYFCTTTRIYRTAAVSTIISGSTTFLSGGDAMVEIPPGGVNTFAASGAMASLEYASELDKFIITVTATTTPFRSYVTGYNTSSAQIDRVVGTDTRQIDQSAADSSTTPFPSYTGGGYTVFSAGGMCYIATNGTTAVTNRIYAMPLSADWEYSDSTFSSVILPAFSTPNCNKYWRAYGLVDEVVGGSSGHNLGTSPDAFRIQYRTSGISDNSGAWTLLDSSGTLASIAGATQIQLRIDFRTISPNMLPARLLAAGVIYDDTSTDTHYQFSVTKSSASAKQFAWRFSTAFGTTVPRLRIRLYDATSGSTLVDDDSTTKTGTWERSTDGVSWSSWNNTDKGNETTYLRFTPASLADNIAVQPTVTLY